MEPLEHVEGQTPPERQRDRLAGLTVHCNKRRQLWAVILSVTATDCIYSIVEDPEEPRRSFVFIQGPSEALEDFKRFLAQFPDARGSESGT